MSKRKSKAEQVVDLFMDATKDEATTLYGVATAIMKRQGLLTRKKSGWKPADKPPKDQQKKEIA